MPRAKNPQKPKIPHLLEIPTMAPRNRIRPQRLRLESALPTIRHRFRRRLAPEPVADPVRVAGPDDGLHARIDDVRELGEEAAGVVASRGEFLVGRIGAFLVRGLGADGFDDG